MQGPCFPLPILVNSYITAWYRRVEAQEKLILLNEYLSTVIKYISHHNNDFVVLLGIHAFFFNENVQGNKSKYKSKVFSLEKKIFE